MKLPAKSLVRIFGLLSFVVAAAFAHAGEQVAPDAVAPVGSRYGLFNLLDHRSSYGQGFLPEPFLVDDSELEPNEFRLDWLHTEGRAAQSDSAKVEIEKGFGLMTLELEIPYEREAASGERTLEGIGNISVGARHPFFQYVSESGGIDTTFGVAMEIGIPVNSAVSKNAEFVPKIFNDLKLGNFTVQSVLGYSTLSGGGAEGGLQAFEYRFVFGYSISHKVLPLPGVLQFIPVFELSGENILNHDEAGTNSLIGNAGFRANLKSIGDIQPRLGVGFVFPLNETAHQDMHWGIVTSLVFQY